MPPRGIRRGVRRFDTSPTFGPVEAAEITKLVRRDPEAADTALRELVHAGVPPSTLWEMAMDQGHRGQRPPA